MKHYLKATYRAALKALKTGDYEDIDKIHSHNSKIMKSVFSRLANFEIDLAYIRKNKNVISYTRSTKNLDAIQRTNFWNRDGELIAMSDQQYSSFFDMERDHWPTNCYVYVN